MQKKLVGYFLLSFFSFSFFTGIFHAVANAETINQTATPITPTIVSPLVTEPTPTLFKRQVSRQQAVQVTSPTPTVYVAKQEVLASSTNATAPAPVVKEVTPLPTALPTAIPTPTAAPAPVTAGPADLEGMFTQYGAQYGVDKEILKKIAKCESGFNPTSNNSGMYLGMFQFAASTWSANRNRMGLDPNPDLRTNAEESIRTAAYMIGKAGTGPWPHCGK